MLTTLSGNHESLESKIPKRKKARHNTRLSCKIVYFIETTSAYPSGRSAFSTDDIVAAVLVDTRFGRLWTARLALLVALLALTLV